MLPDRVSNPGPLTYESGALPMLTDSTRKYLRRIVGLYDKKKIMSFATVLCLVPENVYGCL